MAAGLLREGKLPITEISMRVGYQSLSSFHRHFRQVIGISPREHRDGRSAKTKR
jgi:AraC-like DNA-binding protein